MRIIKTNATEIPVSAELNYHEKSRAKSWIPFGQKNVWSIS